MCVYVGERGEKGVGGGGGLLHHQLKTISQLVSDSDGCLSDVADVTSCAGRYQ